MQAVAIDRSVRIKNHCSVLLKTQRQAHGRESRRAGRKRSRGATTRCVRVGIGVGEWRLHLRQRLRCVCVCVCVGVGVGVGNCVGVGVGVGPSTASFTALLNACLAACILCRLISSASG